MAIGITEEHEELRQAVRRFVDTNIPPAAVARRGRRRRPRPGPTFWAALVRAGLARACTSTRRTAAPATGWSSRRWWSRSSAARARPVRTSPTAIAAAVLAGATAGRRPTRCCRSWRRASSPARSRSTAPDPVLGGARRRRDRVRDRRRVGTRSTRRDVQRDRGRRASTSRAASRELDLDGVRSRRPTGGSPGSTVGTGARRSPRCCSRPRRSASRSGASTPRPSTRRCACSSAARSASSRA